MKSFSFESVEELEKVMPNWSFTLESKMGNSHKAGHVSNFSTNVKDLLMNWDKYVGKNGILNPLEIWHVL